MKNIFNLFSIENFILNLKNTFKRFPISTIIIIIIFSIFFILVNFKSSDSEIWKKLLTINLSLIITFFFSIAIYLTTESFNYFWFKKQFFQIIPIIFWITFYNIFIVDPNNFNNILFFILSLIWIIAYLFFAPYFKNIFLIFLKKWKSIKILPNSTFYNYFYKISTALLSSFIFGVILLILGSIAITAIDNLFNLNIKDKYTYWNWVIISLSLIAPLFFLNEIPKKENYLKNDFSTNKFFSFLIKYVAIPFIYIYFFILYAYSIKVLLNLEAWPRGVISWLIIWFSIFWYLTYIFSYPFKKENKAIAIFRKIFPYVVIPQIFILFYAIILRISQYDITINRYFVVVFWIWLLVISLYFILSKKKNLIIIPTSLALFIIIISIIPKYNVYTYPELRQTQRLIKDLKKAEILKNWKIIPLKDYTDIPKNLSKNIYSEIEYLCTYYKCETIKKIFPKIYSEIYNKSKKQWEENIKNHIESNLKNQKFKWPNKWEIINWITERIKVKNYFFENNINKKYIIFAIDYKKNIFPINIKWYSKIYKIKNDNYWKENQEYIEYNADS